ncbi:MAG: GspE/PulE family protein [Patescibacteria group bacterium]|nr:GspE/PulE family protein [Patescibacteria group bacterium]
MTDEVLLGELEKRNLLAADQLNKIKREAYLAGRTVESLIYERHLVEDSKIAELKSSVLRVPYKKLDLSKYDESLLKIIPEETARTYALAPLSKDGDNLVVGMINPDDVRAQEALKFIARREHLGLGIYLISYSDWQEILRKYSPFRSEVEAAVSAISVQPGTVRKLVRLEEAKGVGAEEAPIIKLVASTFKEAVQSAASDIHIEPQQNYLRIRFRVDGELKEVASLPIELSQPIISRVKVISELKLDETRVPQDGRFRSAILDREIDFRVSTFPTPSGEKVAIRVLDSTVGLKKMDQLGLNDHNRGIVDTALNKPYGMILITGPTGSGKTTTLYALLQTLNSDKVNIVSLEDPVEYFISGINQSQVKPEIGYDFASGLREILRQDPDIIMVGEIRDNETAGLAIHAALTGHIVLSTLHTNNAVGVIPRLADMKVESFLLPSALNLMLSQRLISLLCQSCKAAEDAPEEIVKVIDASVKDLPPEALSQIKKPYKIYHSPGCPVCNGKGVKGRVAIYEIFQMTHQLEEIINKGGDSAAILEESRRQQMITLRQDGIIKALQGFVSIEEVLRETE